MAGPGFSPGFWRRIELHPAQGAIVAGLEDDVHRFLVRLEHRDGIIVGAVAKAERFPWSTCADAAPFLAEQLVGKSWQALAELDAHSHCTHLFDLAVLCAAHADDAGPVRFDMRVADRIEGRTNATLFENDVAVVQWQLNGTLIEGPAQWAGLDMRKLSVWKRDLTPAQARYAMLLRRAVYVSGARAHADRMVGRAADRGPDRMGACFTYQMPRALDAEASRNPLNDFSAADTGPLQGFDPKALQPEDRANS